MKKNLKFKFKILLFSLIAINALMIFLSLIKLFNIRKSVDELMTYNFESINAINNMLDYSDKQNIALLNYIATQNPSYKIEFYNINHSFIDSYEFQTSRVYESGEHEITKQIHTSYNIYLNACEDIFSKETSEIIDVHLTDYYDKIQINYIDLKKHLNDLYDINKNALTIKMTHAQEEIRLSFNLLLFICLFTVVFSLIVSNRYLNKLLLPLSTLHKAIKSFKDGSFSFESQVYSEDEIGELYKEFKNMSDKIVEFKNSTLGQLVEEKNKSLSIVKSISNPLIVLDSNFKCILVNNSCENYFNIEEQNILGKHILDFIPNKDLYDFIYESKRERVQGKTKIMSFDEEKYVFNISISTIISMNSDLNGIIIYFQDITKIKKLDHVKFDFISTLSHELKTPLTSIMMGASMLEEESIIKNKEESGKIIETLQEDSQKLLDMIDNLLRLTELENEQNYLNLEATDISEIINNSIRNFITIALSKNINIVFEKDKNIPLLNIDREKFFWVVNNLLSNAIKYSLQYGDIIIKLKYRKKVVILTIKDFGIGISPESIPKIFDKFYRENELSNGTGLGLPLSKQIIELHNGTISCESKLGEGSIFEVNIPIIGGNL